MPNDILPAAASVQEDLTKIQSFLSDDTWAHASSRWLNDHVRNSPISQSVEAWNHLGTILPKLRDYLRDELKK